LKQVAKAIGPNPKKRKGARTKTHMRAKTTKEGASSLLKSKG